MVAGNFLFSGLCKQKAGNVLVAPAQIHADRDQASGDRGGRG